MVRKKSGKGASEKKIRKFMEAYLLDNLEYLPLEYHPRPLFWMVIWKSCMSASEKKMKIFMEAFLPGGLEYLSGGLGW